MASSGALERNESF